MAKVNIDLTDQNLTEEEKDERRQTILQNEDDLLTGLLEAASFNESETKKIEIIRAGKKFFEFSIHPITEEDLNDIRKKYTKYSRNRRQGIKVAEELDGPKYRASLIYNSTIEIDQERLWDNQRVWSGLRAKGKVIVNALDVIEAVLLPGEKDRILDIIDDINGYNTEDIKVETAKN